MKKLLLAALLIPGVASAQVSISGFAGMMVCDSTIMVGDTKLVDAGCDAPLAGARAGLGHRWPAGLYVGFEGEAFAASGRSRAVVNGVGYDLSFNGGAGAYGRVGWQTRGGALFFARGGALALLTNQGTRWMPDVGVGAEVPFSERWFARVDLSYAWSDLEVYRGMISVGVRIP